MTSKTIVQLPPIRIEPSFKADIESVLEKNETISSFVMKVVKSQVEHRKSQQDFNARALASRNKAKETGIYIPAEVTIKKLETMLENARKSRKV